mmetsp:Transcript_48562/g.98833  ORF Transcript_48562/g.98833 Transcript_48562/m.98833 type:complete len:142 (-) Transcript_48562:49-474(-)
MAKRVSGFVASWTQPPRGKRNAEGYGFVTEDGRESGKGSDLFLYADSIKDSKLRSQAKIFGLKSGTKIIFDIEEPKSGRHSRLAVNVCPAGEGSSGGDDRGHGGRSRRSRSRSPRSRTPPRRRSPTPRRRPPPSRRRSDSR